MSKKRHMIQRKIKMPNITDDNVQGLVVELMGIVEKQSKEIDRLNKVIKRLMEKTNV